MLANMSAQSMPGAEAPVKGGAAALVVGGVLAVVAGVVQWFVGQFAFGVFVLHPVASGMVAVWAVATGILPWRSSAE